MHLPGKDILRHWLQSPSSISGLQQPDPVHKHNPLDLIFSAPCDNTLNPDTIIADLIDYVNDTSDVNTKSSEGKTMLHLAIDRINSCHDKLKVVSFISTLDIDVNIIDKQGESALTLLGQHLPERSDSQEAQNSTEREYIAQIALILLRMGANVNHTNKKGFSLLSYSLKHLDSSIELTRLLLNYGSDLLNNRDSSKNYPLAIFIRSILQQGSLENAGRSIHLLGSVLSASKNPGDYESAVRSTLLAEAKHPRSHVPNLIIELKDKFEFYWSEPSSLMNISIHTIRDVLINNNNDTRQYICIDDKIENLGLPGKLHNYLNLYNFSTSDTHNYQSKQPTIKPVFQFNCDPLAATGDLRRRQLAASCAASSSNMPKTDDNNDENAKDEFVTLTLKHILQTSLKSL